MKPSVYFYSIYRNVENQAVMIKKDKIPWASTFDDVWEGDLLEDTVHSYKGSCNNTSSIVSNTSWDFLNTSKVFSEHL